MRESRNEIFESIYQQMNEAKVPETGPELAKAIEAVIRKHFPKSFIKSDFTGGITESVNIRFALGKDANAWPNNLINNDPLHHSISIFGGFGEGGQQASPNKGPVNIFSKGTSGENEQIVGTLRASLGVGGHGGKHPNRIKLPWRKKSGDAAAMVKHFDTYFGRVKKIVADNPESFGG